MDHAARGRSDPDPRLAALAAIRATPLHRIPSRDVEPVVDRVLDRKTAGHVVPVATFNSTI